MKKRVFLTMVLLLGFLAPQGAKAYDFSAVAPTGQMLYYKIVDGNACVANPLGNDWGSNPKPTGDLTIPSTVNFYLTTYPVTSIEDNAFKGCESLTSVTIPNSVTSISYNAFYGCTSLTSVTIPNSVTRIEGNAFYGCTSLTSVTVPVSVNSIGDNAFSGCTSLTSVTIPNSVTSIGGGAFSGCTSLTSVIVPISVNSVGDNAFSGVLNVVYNGSLFGCPWGGENCLNYGSDTDGLIYSDATKTVVTGYVEGLTHAVIPSSVTSIGEHAFLNCESLTSVDIPNSVTSIGFGAFEHCTRLASVIIPNSVTSIGEAAFSYCPGLTSISVESGNTVYDSRDNCNAIIETATYTLIAGCKNTIIPNSVNSIGDYAFYCCRDLTSVTIPNSVISIGDKAFSGCTSLTSVTVPDFVISVGDNAFSGVQNVVYSGSLTGGCPWGGGNCISTNGYVSDGLIYSDATKTTVIGFVAGLSYANIPNSVTSIGNGAFENCTTLTSVTIPNSVISIGNHAFYGCESLTSVTIPNSVTSIGDFTFNGCESLSSVTIPNSVTSIGNATFRFCTGLTSVTIPNSVTSIGGFAFNGCENLTSVTIPNSVTSIGNRAFSGCTSLTSVTVPNSVTSVGDESFVGVQNVVYNGSLTGCPWGGANCINNGFTVTVAAYDDAMGTVTGGGIYAAGASATLTATANEGYRFVRWDDGNTANPRTVTVTEDATYIALFAVVLPPVSVSGGITIERTYKVHWGNEYNYQRMTIVFDNDNSINSFAVYYPYTVWRDWWYGKGLSVVVGETEDGEDNLWRSENFTAEWNLGDVLTDQWVDEKVELADDGTLYYYQNGELLGSRNFPELNLENVHSFFISFGPNGWWTGHYHYMSHLKITAGQTVIEDDFNTFNEDLWQTPVNPDGVRVEDGMVKMEQLRTDEDFELCSKEIVLNGYTVTARANGAAMGTVTGGGIYAAGASATLTATANEGYRFVRWDDGNTDNPRTVTVTGDATYIALFAVVLPSYTLRDTVATACDRFTWNRTGETYYQSGEYEHVYQDGDGGICKLTLHLTVAHSRKSHEYVTNCGPYTWNANGQTYNKSGTKYYKGTTSDGCPIRDTLTLVVNAIPRNHEYVTSCGSYTWSANGQTYNKSGTKYYKGTTPEGCPIYDTLTLTVLNNQGKHQYVSNCGPYTWERSGQTYNKGGDKYYRGPNADGCVVRDTLTLTVLNNRGTHEYVTNCGPYTWERSSQTYNKGGDKYYRGPNADGCVVRDTLSLTVLNNRGTHEYVTNCGPYTWERSGQTYNKGGNKYYRGPNADGCVVRDTLTLTVLNNQGKHQYVSNCGPYTWERSGQTYNKGGDKYYRGANADGCVVRDTLTLTVLNNQGTHEYVDNCGPYTWERSGQTYNKGGDKYYRGANADGCVVRDTLTLTVLNNRGTREYVTNCGPYTWERSGQTYNKGGDKYYRGPNADGCVVRDTLTLTVLNNQGTHEYVTNCGSYTWERSGQTYNKGGDKYYRGPNADGCIVRDTLTLTVLNNQGTHEYVTNCGSYTWERSGQTYNKGGDKYYRGPNADGCIVRDTLTLTVASGRSSHEYVTNCGPYTWEVNGQTYNKSGTKYYKSTTPEGCPIRDTLTLTVASGRSSHEYVTNCGPYMWSATGKTYNKSGVKYYKGTTEEGCPIRDTLTLTVVDRWTSHDTVVNNGPYTWAVNGKTYNKSGVKTYKGTADDGCPTYDTLTLVITSKGGNSQEALAESTSGTWNLQNSNFEIQHLKVYPNPTTGRVELNVAEADRIEVLDLVGRRVAVYKNTNSIDLSNLADGTYTLRITLPEGVTLLKVVKQ